MFDLKAVKYKKHVPYIEMLHNALIAVSQICNGDGRFDFSTVGEDCLRAVAMFSTFTDVSSKTIGEDIDGFMDAWYNKHLYTTLLEKSNVSEIAAFERAVDKGIERYYAKPPVDKLLDKMNGMMDELSAAVKSLPENNENK